MKILLTGATGYIAQRLIPVLLGNGHIVICCVRDKARFDSGKYRSSDLSVLEVDFLKPDTLKNIPASDPGLTDSYNNPGWGYSTGHNSDGLTRYAEYMSYTGTGEIAWVKLSVAYASALILKTRSLDLLLQRNRSERKLKLSGPIQNGSGLFHVQMGMR